MSLSRRISVALSAIILVVVGASTPVQAQAQETNPVAVISSLLPPEVGQAIYLSAAIPVISTSMFLSYVLNIPQCGLHDTRAC